MAFSGERLRDLREKRGFKQEELAAMVGISTRLLQKYEANENDPSTGNAAKLADALMTTVDYLADRVPDSAPYIQGELSILERLIIFLLRRGQLPAHVETAINQAISAPGQMLHDDSNQPASSHKLLPGAKRSKPQ